MILVIKIGEKKGEMGLARHTSRKARRAGLFNQKLITREKFQVDKTLSSKILEVMEKILKNPEGKHSASYGAGKKIKIQDLKGIILSVNPNIFTSQRIGIVSVNTFFLTHKIPLFLIPKEVSLKKAFLNGKDKLSKIFLKPVYFREPNITKPAQIFGLLPSAKNSQSSPKTWAGKNKNMKKTILKTFLVITSLFLFAGVSRGAENIPVADEWIMDFKAHIKINEDSSINVTEAITYNFGSKQKHGIYRDIPYKYRDKQGGTYNAIIKVRSVKDENGQNYNYEVSKTNGYIDIKIGDQNVFITGLKTYIINYTAERELGFFKDHDELYWNITGNKWPVQIVNSEATVVLPKEGDISAMKAACYTGPFGSKESNCEAKVRDSRTFYFKSNNTLSYFNGLTLVVGFNKGIVKELSFSKKLFLFIQDNYVFTLPIIVFIIMFYLWFSRGRDPKGKGTIIPQYEAPQNLTPAEIGAIFDEKADTQDVSATLIHLAIKGYLKIRAITGEGIFRSRDYEFIKLKDEDISLKLFEKRLLAGIFGSFERRPLSSLKNKFYLDMEDIKKKIYEEIVKKGYFPKSPEKIRNIYRVIGIGSIALGFFAFTSQNFYLIASLIISGLIIFGFSFIMPRKTQKGSVVYEEILGLRQFLSITEEERLKFHNAPEKTPELFEKFLPYAMVLGVENKWANEFKDIYTNLPSWYEGGFRGPFNALVFINILNSVTASTANTFVSRPGGSSGFGGGSGFSGGGGGGGGGGSW